MSRLKGFAKNKNLKGVSKKMATENSATKKKTYTEEELAKAVAEASKKAAEEAIKAYAASNPQQTILQVAKDEYVTVVYIGGIASGTVVALPKMGTITYAGGMLDVPKKDFLQALGNRTNEALIRKRSLIVLNGLTDEERKRFNCDYKPQETLTQNAFFELLDYDKEQIIAVYSKLCDEHKKVVAKIYLSAYFEMSDKRINPETVKELNNISKSIDKDGLFTPILTDFGEKFAE